MSLTFEDLERANEGLKPIPFKGKNYVMVNEKIKGFRKVCPMGQIDTEILSLDDETVTMKASVLIDGVLVSTGIAQEVKSASYINKTSFIENCQTSAIGRALGFLGIGIDDAISSADELANALTQQEQLKSPISKKEQKILTNTIEKAGLKVEDVLNGMKLEEVTGEKYLDAMKRLESLIEKKEAAKE